MINWQRAHDAHDRLVCEVTMPYTLKIIITILGIMGCVCTKYKISNPDIYDIIQFIIVYGFFALLIFGPWIINKRR